jgi:hypothetical protein
MFNQLDKWHKTRGGYLLFAVVELALAYLAISLGVDRGNLLWYLLALVLLVGGLQNLFKLIGTFFHGKSRRTR